MGQVCRHGVSVPSIHHDCDYVDLRTRLVPRAEKYANEMAGPRPAMKHGAGAGALATNEQYEAWCIAWNLLFHTYIDQAVAEYYTAKRARVEVAP